MNVLRTLADVQEAATRAGLQVERPRRHQLLVPGLKVLVATGGPDDAIWVDAVAARVEHVCFIPDASPWLLARFAAAAAEFKPHPVP